MPLRARLRRKFCGVARAAIHPKLATVQPRPGSLWSPPRVFNFLLNALFHMGLMRQNVKSRRTMILANMPISDAV